MVDEAENVYVLKILVVAVWGTVPPINDVGNAHPVGICIAVDVE